MTEKNMDLWRELPPLLKTLMTQDYLVNEAAKGNYDDFLKVLHNVPQNEPEKYDKI